MEPNDIVLASTTESKEALEFAANASRTERFDPAKVVEKTVEESPKDASGKPSESGTEDDSKVEAKTKTPAEQDDDKDLPEGVKRRLGKYTRIARDAEAKANELQERIRALEEAKSTPEATKKATEGDPKPKESDFAGKPLADYIEALTRWTTRQEKTVEAQKANDAVELERQKGVLKDYNDKIVKGRDEFDDWDDAAEAITKADLPLAQSAHLAFLELDNPAAVMHYLGKHIDEAQAICKLTPLRQVFKLGQISADLAKAAAKKPTSKAPEPITPSRGGSASSARVDLSSIENTDDYITVRKAQIKANARRN